MSCIAASVKIVYEPQPTPQQIAGLAGAVITRVWHLSWCLSFIRGIWAAPPIQRAPTQPNPARCKVAQSGDPGTCLVEAGSAYSLNLKTVAWNNTGRAPYAKSLA